MPTNHKVDLAVHLPPGFEVDAEDLALETDPVLSALDQAAAAHREARAETERLAIEAEQALRAVEQARVAEHAAHTELEQMRGEVHTQRARADQQSDRADKLLQALRDVHKTLFGGNVFEAILRASLSLTGATRGVYLSVYEGSSPQVRAAIGVVGYPGKAPSNFLSALANRAMKSNETFVCNDATEFAEFPKPDGEGERFQDCLVAPAVLLERLNGVVILAEKEGGFDDQDRETVMSVGQNAGVAVHNQQLQAELMRAYFSVVGVLADAMEVKDPYTKGHCEVVARWSRLTATKLAETDEKLRSVCCYGGLLHDVGKIGVSDGVLNKPGRLTPEEWSLMQSHVRIGRDLLAKVPELDGVVDVILHHHERWDGGGYPDGLQAEAIPLASRIVGVVDAYSAMISKRSYKDSMSSIEARAELTKCKGTHFDPAVVDAFLAVLDDPEPKPDATADGSWVMPGLHGADDFRHVLRRGQRV